MDNVVQFGKSYDDLLEDMVGPGMPRTSFVVIDGYEIPGLSVADRGEYMEFYFHDNWSVCHQVKRENAYSFANGAAYGLRHGSKSDRLGKIINFVEIVD